MHGGWVGGGVEGADHEVADAAGFEGAAGLVVFELEVDVAGREAGEFGGEDGGGSDPGDRGLGGKGTHGG